MKINHINNPILRNFCFYIFLKYILLIILMDPNFKITVTKFVNVITVFHNLDLESIYWIVFQ